MQTFSSKKLHLKTSSAKWRLFCLGLNELKCEFHIHKHVDDDRYSGYTWLLQEAIEKNYLGKC